MSTFHSLLWLLLPGLSTPQLVCPQTWTTWRVWVTTQRKIVLNYLDLTLPLQHPLGPPHTSANIATQCKDINCTVLSALLVLLTSALSEQEGEKKLPRDLTVIAASLYTLWGSHFLTEGCVANGRVCVENRVTEILGASSHQIACPN